MFVHTYTRVVLMAFTLLRTCCREDLTIHVSPTSRDGRRGVGVPRAKSIFLLKKKAKQPVHVNTATCALQQEVKRGAAGCTSLDYGEGGGEKVEGRASSE